jgi:hypothetical protein
MPNFYVWSRDNCGEDAFWVYAIDDWDARNQVSEALALPTHDAFLFGCKEDNRFKTPLDVIIHATGERTQVPAPAFLAADCAPSSDYFW